MAFTCGFFNSENGDRKYNAEQMSAIFDGIIADGVFATIGDHMVVTAGTGMQVLVGTGKAWFDHTWNVNDSLYSLKIAKSDVSLDRIDAVVLETNHSDSVRFNGFKVITGSPAADPAKPVLTNTELIHQHPLAWIRVTAGATAITASMIENVVGTSECPFVTGVIEVTNIDDIFNQWQGEFDEWFANLKIQLSGDVAANLQRQIDECKVLNDTKEAYGLPKNASNDDVFKNILDRFSQKEREANLTNYDTSLADELGINMIEFLKNNSYSNTLVRVSASCPIIIKNDSRITIIPATDGNVYYYRLKGENAYHRVDMSDLKSRIPNIDYSYGILFDYDGAYFYVLAQLGRGKSTTTWTIHLLRTRDFTSYETMATYLNNSENLGWTRAIATSKGKRYIKIKKDSDWYVCELSTSSLNLRKTPINNKTFEQNGFYDDYFYNIVGQTNTIRIVKTHFTSGQPQYIDIHTSKAVSSSECAVIKCRGKIYLFLMSLNYDDVRISVSKNRVSCLVSSDNGNTFVEKDLTNLLDASESSCQFWIKYNNVSDRLFLIKAASGNNILYELNADDEFEYVRIFTNHPYSSVDGLDEDTFLGCITKTVSYRQSESSSSYHVTDLHHPSVFKLSGKIKTRGEKSSIQVEIVETNRSNYIPFSGIIRSIYDESKHGYIYPDYSYYGQNLLNVGLRCPFWFVNSIVYLGTSDSSSKSNNIGIIEIP